MTADPLPPARCPVAPPPVPWSHIASTLIPCSPNAISATAFDATLPAALRAHVARCASVLRVLGVARGERVATLLPQSPDLVSTTLALWRWGAVQVPLDTAFGPQAMMHRRDRVRLRHPRRVATF